MRRCLTTKGILAAENVAAARHLEGANSLVKREALVASKTGAFASLATLWVSMACFSRVLKCLTLTLSVSQLNFIQTVVKSCEGDWHAIAITSAFTIRAGMDCL